MSRRVAVEVLSLLVKDTRIAVGLGRSTGGRGRHSAATLALWERALEELSPNADHTDIHRWEQNS